MNTKRYCLSLDSPQTEALRRQARGNFRSLSAEVRKLISEHNARLRRGGSATVERATGAFNVEEVTRSQTTNGELP